MMNNTFRSRASHLAKRPLSLEHLEERLALAVQLIYHGFGDTLKLTELSSAGIATVSVLESAPGVLKIDLGTQTFDASSTPSALGLTYAGSGPTTSTSATIDISLLDNINTLQAKLPNDTLILGVPLNAKGGLVNVDASADLIEVTGLNSALTGASFDLRASQELTVTENAVIDAGRGTIALAAGVNDDGSASSTGGVLTIHAGAMIASDAVDNNAITLRGSDIDIDNASTNPVLVGARWPTKPAATLTGVDNPTSLTIDAENKLYVASQFGTTVSVFHPNTTTPDPALTHVGLNNPAGMLVDSIGYLYVANFDGTTINFFLHDTTTPDPNIVYTGLDAPGTLIFDSQENLYAINYGLGFDTPNTVSRFTRGLAVGNPDITLTGLDGPVALAVDARDYVYVANFSADTVSVFKPGSTTPDFTLTGLDAPSALAFDANNNLYVANPHDDPFVAGTTASVFEIAYDASGNLLPSSLTPARTLTGLRVPTALAFDAAGNLYVANLAGGPDTLGSISVIPPGKTAPTREMTGIQRPTEMLVDRDGNLFVINDEDLVRYTPTVPIPTAGGVVISTAQPNVPISLGDDSGIGFVLSDAELSRIFTIASGNVTIGDSPYAGNIIVTANVAPHAGYNTLSLHTQQGTINTAAGATLAVANLALAAGSGIGSTGPMSIDAANLAFANQSGAIQLNEANTVMLTGVGPLAQSSIPGDIFAASNVGDVYTLLHSSGGVSGQLSQALFEGATLVLADGNTYRISYLANGGKDATLTRVIIPGPLPPTPPPGVNLVGSTLVVNGSAGNDHVTLTQLGSMLQVYASFLPGLNRFQRFPSAAVTEVTMDLGAGNDFATVSSFLRVPVFIDGGPGDDVLAAGGGNAILLGGAGKDQLFAGAGRNLLIGGADSDVLSAGLSGGSILIGDRTSHDANDVALRAILAEWSSSRSLSERIANLTDGSGSPSRLNRGAFLNASTLIDDGVADYLFGNFERDWFPGLAGRFRFRPSARALM